jgi:hypothetical protein
MLAGSLADWLSLISSFLTLSVLTMPFVLDVAFRVGNERATLQKIDVDVRLADLHQLFIGKNRVSMVFKVRDDNIGLVFLDEYIGIGQNPCKETDIDGEGLVHFIVDNGPEKQLCIDRMVLSSCTLLDANRMALQCMEDLQRHHTDAKVGWRTPWARQNLSSPNAPQRDAPAITERAGLAPQHDAPPKKRAKTKR